MKNKIKIHNISVLDIASLIIRAVVTKCCGHLRQLRELAALLDQLDPEALIEWLFYWKPYLRGKGLFWAFALTYDEFTLWLLVHKSYCLSLLRRWCSDFNEADNEAVFFMLFEKYNEANYHKFIWLNKQRLAACLRWVKEDYRRKHKREQSVAIEDFDVLPVQEVKHYTLTDRNTEFMQKHDTLLICTKIKELFGFGPDSRHGIVIEIARQQGTLLKPRFLYELMSKDQQKIFLPKNFKGDECERRAAATKCISNIRRRLLEMLDEYRKQTPEIEMLYSGKN